MLFLFGPELKRASAVFVWPRTQACKFCFCLAQKSSLVFQPDALGFGFWALDFGF
jgi:hypothetical protein